jgi:hypothetical protein
MAQDPFAQFIENLLLEQGASELPAEVQKNMRAELAEQLQAFLMAKLVAHLAEDDRTRLAELVTSGAPNTELVEFFRASLGDQYSEIIITILADFRASYVG